VNPTAIVDALGYPAAGLGILIESAGVPFPGEALLLAAAAWSAARHQSIVLVILFGFLGSVAGADIGYALGQCWWTFCFEREKSDESVIPEGAESWRIEAYDHNGISWASNYYYWPAENRWRHALYQSHGENYGRHNGVRRSEKHC